MTRNSQQLEEFKEQIDKFLQFNKDNLITRPEWGTITLEEARIDFDRIYEIIEYLKLLPYNKLPRDIITAILNEMRQIIHLFDEINKFSVEIENPVQKRNQFIVQIQTCADSLYKNVSMWIPFLAYQKGDVSKNIESLTKTLKEAENLIDATKKKISDREKEIQDIIIKAREASAAAGAAVFTKDFQEESNFLKQTANKWLKATICFASITIILGFIMWWLTEPGLDTGQLFQKIGTKLLILLILISGTVWCGKIYKALMHQSTINRHRALSIQTLQAFSASVENAQVKDTVVLEAARAIFSNVPTGFIESAGFSSDHDIKILEIVKSIIPKTGG